MNDFDVPGFIILTDNDLPDLTEFGFEDKSPKTHIQTLKDKESILNYQIIS